MDNAQWRKQFRNRFRLPYGESFIDILCKVRELENDVIVTDPFAHWRLTKENESGKKKTKVLLIELLLLGSLRYLGRGWTFDNIQESTYINRDVHRNFFHNFTEFGATRLYPKYAMIPSTLEELKVSEL